MAEASRLQVDAPPDVLQLAGHPVRWRLLRELAGSDRRVGELCDLTGERQSLVSYHLAEALAARMSDGAIRAASAGSTRSRCTRSPCR